jgi:hypothetical protein
MYYKKFERSEIYELIQRVRAECTILGGASTVVVLCVVVVKT